MVNKQLIIGMQISLSSSNLYLGFNVKLKHKYFVV